MCRVHYLSTQVDLLFGWVYSCINTVQQMLVNNYRLLPSLAVFFINEQMITAVINRTFYRPKTLCSA